MKRPNALNTLGIQFAEQAKACVPDKPLSAGGTVEAVNTGSSGRPNSLEGEHALCGLQTVWPTFLWWRYSQSKQKNSCLRGSSGI